MRGAVRRLKFVPCMYGANSAITGIAQTVWETQGHLFHGHGHVVESGGCAKPRVACGRSLAGFVFVFCRRAPQGARLIESASMPLVPALPLVETRCLERARARENARRMRTIKMRLLATAVLRYFGIAPAGGRLHWL